MRSLSLQCFRATCLCAVQLLLIPSIIPYRIGCWANNRYDNDEDRYLSRGTIARLRGLSIGIVSSNMVRALATKPRCATEMLAKVYIERYLGHQHDLKMTPNKRSFEQHLFIAANQYLVVEAIGVRWNRSMIIAQFSRFARVSIDMYWQFNRSARVSIDTYCLYPVAHNCIPITYTLGYCLN